MSKVLVLEDSPERIDWFKQTFGDIDHTDDVNKAYAMLQGNKYDLVFLDRDISNPKLTGEDLAWQMLQDKAIPETPVIIHSENSRGQRVMAKYLGKYKNNVLGMRFAQLSRHTKDQILEMSGVTTIKTSKAVVPQEKQSQSVMQFMLNNLPNNTMQFVGIRQETTDAAELLYSTWKSASNNKSPSKLLKVPSSVSDNQIKKMEMIGLVRSKGNSTVEITRVGAEILKKMILDDETSSLEPNKKYSKVSKTQNIKTAQKNVEQQKAKESFEDKWWKSILE